MEYPIFRDVDNFIIRVNQEREKKKKATPKKKRKTLSTPLL